MNADPTNADHNARIGQTLHSAMDVMGEVFDPDDQPVLQLCEHLAMAALHFGAYNLEADPTRACGSHPQLGVMCPACYGTHISEHRSASARCTGCGSACRKLEGRYTDAFLADVWRGRFLSGEPRLRFGGTWVRVGNTANLCADCAELMPQSGFSPVVIAPRPDEINSNSTAVSGGGL